MRTYLFDTFFRSTHSIPSILESAVDEDNKLKPGVAERLVELKFCAQMPTVEQVTRQISSDECIETVSLSTGQCLITVSQA